MKYFLCKRKCGMIDLMMERGQKKMEARMKISSIFVGILKKDK
jgi:hypothetical protein